MSKRLAIFSGTFNPPGRHHRAAVEALLRLFDEIIVVPGGPRPDRPVPGLIDPLHRAVMADLAFRGLPGVRVDYSDLEHARFTRTHILEERYGQEGEVWHAVGTDMLRGGGAGRSFVHGSWEGGRELWGKLNFAVIQRDGYGLEEADLPPRHLFVPTRQSGASGEVRERIFRGTRYDELLTPEVASYVDRHGLYHAAAPVRPKPFSLSEPRPLAVFDELNPEARRLAGGFASVGPEAANCVLVAGGDGTMIRAVRQHWKLRLPFIGLNVGHRGHLLNDPGALSGPSALARELDVQLMPLLYVETEDMSGRITQHYAINDAWVERAGGQAAWLRMTVDGEVRIGRLVADGALASTAVGSTAYAKAMGATPLPADARAFLVVGSNVAEPTGWKSAHLPFGAELLIESLDPVKRPVRAYVDGSGKGIVRSIRIRMSRTAAAELAFVPGRDMHAKLTEALFP